MTRRVLLPLRHKTRAQTYIEAGHAAGLEVEGRLTAGKLSLDGAAGLMLMGGSDVNPQQYGEARHPKTEKSDDERDQIEIELVHEARHKGLPIFAICRGMQLLNVAIGGTLIQHLPNSVKHQNKPEDKSLAVHAISIEPDSLLGRIAGVPSWPVNSRHHQAVGELARGLRVTATDPEDGVIEAVEGTDGPFLLAVQWHPEDQVRRFPDQLRLFRGFSDAL